MRKTIQTAIVVIGAFAMLLALPTAVSGLEQIVLSEDFEGETWASLEQQGWKMAWDSPYFSPTLSVINGKLFVDMQAGGWGLSTFVWRADAWTNHSASVRFNSVNYWRHSTVIILFRASGFPEVGGGYANLTAWKGLGIWMGGTYGKPYSLRLVTDDDGDGAREVYEYKTDSSLPPYYNAWHTIKGEISGNNAKIWIDGTLWADVTDEKISRLPAGGIAMISYEADTLYDDLIVSVPGAPEKPTSIAISPENFIVSSDGSIVLTATLSSEGSPLPSMKVNWTATVGSIIAASETTDDSGQVSITYTAPKVGSATDVTVTASFEGDGEYLLSTGSSSGKVGTIKVDLDPDTLNLKSNGKWITGYIELSSGLKVKDIDIGTVKLEYKEHEIKAARGSIDDGVLMTKFDRRELVNLLKSEARPAEVKLQVTGNIVLKGTAVPFAACDTVRVIMPGRTSRVNVGFNVEL
ncbi:MAG: Ig-like domain-containing protein [Candidatus Hadarchaeota archaeon]